MTAPGTHTKKRGCVCVSGISRRTGTRLHLADSQPPPLVGGEAVREYRKDEHTDGEGSILFIFYISGNMPGGLRVRVCTELDKQTGFWEQSSEKGGVDFGGHFLPVCRHEL